MVNYMSLEEFWKGGYLQELNRQFLHPLGLALEATVDLEGNISLSGVWDYRHDEEGMVYPEDVGFGPSPAHVEKIAAEQAEKAAVRMERFGWIIQPVNAS